MRDGDGYCFPREHVQIEGGVGGRDNPFSLLAAGHVGEGATGIHNGRLCCYVPVG
jgi:hypothetical protein